MTENTYIKKYVIGYYETGYDKKLKPAQWLNYFQDAAIWHGEHVGRGLKFLDEHDLLWVLMEWDICIFDQAPFADTVTVKTRQHSSNGLYCKRIYEAVNDEGKVIASAESIWMMLQKSSMKIIKVPDYILSAYGGKADRKSWIKTNKLDYIHDSDSMVLTEVKVNINDIDSNHHVNNQKYVEWAVQQIPYEIFVEFPIKRIRVNYLKSALNGYNLYLETRIIKEDEGYTLKQSVRDLENVMYCIIELRL